MDNENFVSLATHNEFAQRQDAENKRQNERIKLLEEQYTEIHDLTYAVKGLAENMADMLEEQKKQGIRLSALENKSTENFKKIGSTVVKTVVTVIVTAIMTFFLCKIGLK